METLSITEVCRRTGLSARSLRFYEARGLITAQRSAADQRRYGPAELARLHQVRRSSAPGSAWRRSARCSGATSSTLPG